ncbi:MAG: prepilin-type N-terminal cleavage/methylation domain-containing protein [Phycisphaerales bacterium]|nr:MAG: prepilin-type N-terminal cleavage/methylation domain-containing protein [Phycisphaerales bacterium]
MNNTRYRHGLTLIELLVAIVVTSIVMGAVATLAFAMGSANKATDDTSLKQAQIRFATMRISELIRHSKLICYANSEEVVVWRADDTPGGEDQINASELVYIETGNNRIRLMDFSSVPVRLETTPLALTQLEGLKPSLMSDCTERYAVLVPECSNVEFGFLPALPPQSRFVTISFDVLENNAVRTYQTNATLRGWAGNLLDSSNEIASDDD